MKLFSFPKVYTYISISTDSKKIPCTMAQVRVTNSTGRKNKQCEKATRISGGP